jgi:hypothetical protein
VRAGESPLRAHDHAETFDALVDQLRDGRNWITTCPPTARWCAFVAAWAFARRAKKSLNNGHRRVTPAPREWPRTRSSGHHRRAAHRVVARGVCRLIHAGAVLGNRWLRRSAQGAHDVPRGRRREVDKASLLGRGGAGFPAGRKWSMLRKSPVSYLVVNGDESEPATFKDHFLVERDPHQLVEGVIIAAYALQVNQAFIYMRGEFALGLERVQQALNDAYETGALGSKIFDSDFSLDIVVHPGAGAYICGEETALIEGLEGKRGFPAHQAAVLSGGDGSLRRTHGGEQRRNHVELAVDHQQRRRGVCRPGRGRSTGTRLFALAGRVNQPGVYEVEMVKNTFRDLIYDPTSAAASLVTRRSRRSSPAAYRRRGSAQKCSTCRSAKTK